VTTTAKRGDMRLIAVILGAPSNAQRFAQAAKVMEWGFDKFTAVSLLKSGQPLPVHVQVHEGPLIQPVASTELKLVVPKTDAASVRLVYDIPASVAGPVTTGEPLGRVIAQDEGAAATEVVAISPIAFTAPHTLGGEAYNAAAPASNNSSQENQ
jgi:D-alanyl-D-alanine carboxypeptidase (penicillin-binding protein 5/6)